MESHQKACEHPVDKALYLTTHYVPNVQFPATMSVAVCLFLCRGCGSTYKTHTEVPRGYLADGSISQEMQDELILQQKIRQKEIEMHRNIEAKVRAEYQAKNNLDHIPRK